MSSTPSDVVRGLHSALEQGVHGEQLRHLFTDDAKTIEQPNRLKPNGAKVELEQMIQASSQGAGLLAWQKYDVSSMLEVGSTVIVRCTWTGEIAADIGGFYAGQQLTAHIAQFIEVTDGKVSSIETYDCYEPF